MKSQLNTIPSLLTECCRKFANKPAMILQNGCSISYRDMSWDISHTSLTLKEQGISGNSKVALFLEDTPQAVETFLAITKMGATALLLTDELTKKQIADMLEAEKPDAVFISEAKLGLLPKTLEATILEMADNRVLKQINRQVSNSIQGVKSEDPAVIVYQITANNKKNRIVYTQNDIARAVRIKKHAKHNVAKEPQTTVFKSILDYAKNLICPVLNGIGIQSRA
jgi:acyl-CoA synthetase (AMP-forming)/AMP-acid ligase II